MSSVCMPAYRYCQNKLEMQYLDLRDPQEILIQEYFFSIKWQGWN